MKNKNHHSQDLSKELEAQEVLLYKHSRQVKLIFKENKLFQIATIKSLNEIILLILNSTKITNHNPLEGVKQE